MGIETRPRGLRDFMHPKSVEKLIRVSPEIQQEVLRFLLSFKEICRKNNDEDALAALVILQDHFVEKYPDFRKSQPVYTEQLKVEEFEPDPVLSSALNGECTINVPERLLERNPEIKQAGLELLLCFWGIYETAQGEEDILKALKVVIEHYVERYPDSVESQFVDTQENISSSNLEDQKILVLNEIFDPEWVSNTLGKIYPPEIGSQFNEARGFERIIVGNPEWQQRLAKSLIGLWEVYYRDGNEEERQRLEAMIKDFTRQYPDFLSPQSEIDHDLGYDSFTPDPRVLVSLEEILNET